MAPPPGEHGGSRVNLHGTAVPRALSDIRDGAERAAILAALEQTDQHILEAAKLLSISRTTLWEKMKKLGIKSDH